MGDAVKKKRVKFIALCQGRRVELETTDEQIVALARAAAPPQFAIELLIHARPALRGDGSCRTR